MNYQDADAKLQGRCCDRRKLENNTYLERRDENAIAVRLHVTDVLTFTVDGHITIRTGGWHTVTTRDRINRYLPRPWTVRSERGATVLYTYGKQGPWTPVALVGNRVAIQPDGTVGGGGDYATFKKEIRKMDNERNRVRSRARYWLRKARGIYVDRSKCQADPHWNCGTRSRWAQSQGLQIGTYACGCVVYRKPARADRLTVESIMAEDNVTVRFAKMHCYGLDRLMLDAGAQVKNREAGYELVELDMGGRGWASEAIRALKMTCPSTGAVYINMVPPHTSSVREGLDWMFSTENYLEQIGQQA